jgi:hypothetical protein
MQWQALQLPQIFTSKPKPLMTITKRNGNLNKNNTQTHAH